MVTYCCLRRGPRGAGVTVVAFLFQTFPFLTVVLGASGSAVLGMLLWTNFGSVVKHSPPSLPKVLKEGVSEAEVKAVVEKLTPYVNKAMRLGHQLLSGKEVVLSFVVGIVLIFLAHMFATVSLLGLMYGSVLIMFSLPKVYEMYQGQIDGVLNMLREKATALHDQVTQQAGLAKKLTRSAKEATPASSSTKQE